MIINNDKSLFEWSYHDPPFDINGDDSDISYDTAQRINIPPSVVFMIAIFRYISQLECNMVS